MFTKFRNLLIAVLLAVPLCIMGAEKPSELTDLAKGMARAGMPYWATGNSRLADWKNTFKYGLGRVYAPRLETKTWVRAYTELSRGNESALLKTLGRSHEQRFSFWGVIMNLLPGTRLQDDLVKESVKVLEEEKKQNPERFAQYHTKAEEVQWRLDKFVNCYYKPNHRDFECQADIPKPIFDAYEDEVNKAAGK